MKEYYYGTYSDAFGTTPIVIENNFQYLLFNIRDIKFQDTDFDHLTVYQSTLLTDFQLAQFTWLNDALINYHIQIALPLTLICMQTQQIISCLADFSFEFGTEHYIAKLAFELAGQSYFASGELLEILFDQIQKQFLGKYRFKNCYGCLYADYSVYGQAFMGSMSCFRNQKQNYLKVMNKDQYMQLEAPIEQVQEIYCCKTFEIRNQNAGYRGVIE